MKRVVEYRGSTPVIVEYLHKPADPLPHPMNSGYLRSKGFKTAPGNIYSLNDVRVHYDGVSWWVYYFMAHFRIETIEEFEKLVIL